MSTPRNNSPPSLDPSSPFSSIDSPSSPFSRIDSPSSPFARIDSPSSPFSRIDSPSSPFPNSPFSSNNSPLSFRRPLGVSSFRNQPNARGILGALARQSGLFSSATPSPTSDIKPSMGDNVAAFADLSSKTSKYLVEGP